MTVYTVYDNKSKAIGTVNVPEVAGPQGPVGPTGPQGPQGSIGVTGHQGLQGATGSIGATGPTGATGPQGPAGLGSPIIAKRAINVGAYADFKVVVKFFGNPETIFWANSPGVYMWIMSLDPTGNVAIWMSGVILDDSIIIS